MAARRRWRAAQTAGNGSSGDCNSSSNSNGELAAAAPAAVAGAGAGAAGAAEEEAVRVNPALRERYLGVLQGLTRREAAQQHPAAFASLSLPAEQPGEVRLLGWLGWLGRRRAWSSRCAPPSFLAHLGLAACC